MFACDHLALGAHGCMEYIRAIAAGQDLFLLTIKNG
jgi:hypothetical protein